MSIVSVSIFAFIFYINFYLTGYIQQETEQKINANISSSTFDKNNEKLTTEWNSLKTKYKIT